MHSLTSAGDRGKWWCLGPADVPKKPGTHPKRGCVGPRDDMDVQKKRKKNLLLLLGFEARFLGGPNHNLVGIPTDLSSLAIQECSFIKWSGYT